MYFKSIINTFNKDKNNINNNKDLIGINKYCNNLILSNLKETYFALIF